MLETFSNKLRGRFVMCGVPNDKKMHLIPVNVLAIKVSNRNILNINLKSNVGYTPLSNFY